MRRPETQPSTSSARAPGLVQLSLLGGQGGPLLADLLEGHLKLRTNLPGSRLRRCCCLLLHRRRELIAPTAHAVSAARWMNAGERARVATKVVTVALRPAARTLFSTERAVACSFRLCAATWNRTSSPSISEPVIATAMSAATSTFSSGGCCGRTRLREVVERELDMLRRLLALLPRRDCSAGLRGGYISRQQSLPRRTRHVCADRWPAAPADTAQRSPVGLLAVWCMITVITLCSAAHGKSRTGPKTAVVGN